MNFSEMRRQRVLEQRMRTHQVKSISDPKVRAAAMIKLAKQIRAEYDRIPTTRTGLAFIAPEFHIYPRLQ